MKAVGTLLQEARQTPFHAYRFIIIPAAERLSTPAVSALLKSLEEPAKQTRYILTTRYKKRILSTIISRCQVSYITAGVSQTPSSSELPQFGTHNGPLTEEELQMITARLQTHLEQHGFSPALLRAFLRLRDYYKIKSERGNEKLASEVLLATVKSV